MSRLLSWIILAAVIGFAPAAVLAQSVTVIVNGQTMNFSQPPIERAGRVFVPLRSVFEQLGASVVYANGQINATRHGRTISLTIGSTQTTVGGNPETVDVAPFIVGATTYVPLRFISQALGASVNWNDSTSTVTINGGGPGGPPPEQMPPPPQQAPPPRPYPGSARFVSFSPTGTIYDAMPTLRFVFDRPVRLADVRVWVDGREATDALRKNGSNFVLNLQWRIARGSHRVRVNGTTASGASFSLSWNFIRG